MARLLHCQPVKSAAVLGYCSYSERCARQLNSTQPHGSLSASIMTRPISGQQLACQVMHAHTYFPTECLPRALSTPKGQLSPPFGSTEAFRVHRGVSWLAATQDVLMNEPGLGEGLMACPAERMPRFCLRMTSNLATAPVAGWNEIKIPFQYSVTAL